MSKKLTLWTQGPMRRIFPLDKPPRPVPPPLRVSAAKGETECLQVGVHVTGYGDRNSLSAEVADLKGPRGATIPAGCVDVLYPELVPVKWAAGEPPDGDLDGHLQHDEQHDDNDGHHDHHHDAADLRGSRGGSA